MHHRAEVFWYLYAVKHGCLGHKQITEQKKLLDVFSDFNGIAISDSQKIIRKLSPLVCNAFMFCMNVQFLSHGNPFWEFQKLAMHMLRCTWDCHYDSGPAMEGETIWIYKYKNSHYNQLAIHRNIWKHFELYIWNSSIAKRLVLGACVSMYAGLHAVPVRVDDINIKNADLLK